MIVEGNRTMDDKELMNKLRHDEIFNPWLGKVEEFQCNLDFGIRQFILVADKIDNYNARINNGGREFLLKTDIPPQPFIGTPEANIWLLLKNPGFSEIDLYDCWGDNVPGCRAMRADRVSEALLQRQRLMISQYRFAQEKGKEFYLLDESFHTSAICGKGGYGWYSRYLFPKDGLLTKYCASESPGDRLMFCSRNIFVLDYHPYHSEKYCDDGADILKENYWDQLVAHGLVNNKLLVFWGSKILGKVKAQFKELYDQAVEQERVFVLKSASAYFSSNCLFQVVGKSGEFLRPYLRLGV